MEDLRQRYDRAYDADLTEHLHYLSLYELDGRTTIDVRREYPPPTQIQHAFIKQWLLELANNLHWALGHSEGPLVQKRTIRRNRKTMTVTYTANKETQCGLTTLQENELLLQHDCLFLKPYAAGTCESKLIVKVDEDDNVTEIVSMINMCLYVRKKTQKRKKPVTEAAAAAADEPVSKKPAATTVVAAPPNPGNLNGVAIGNHKPSNVRSVLYGAAIGTALPLLCNVVKRMNFYYTYKGWPSEETWVDLFDSSAVMGSAAMHVLTIFLNENSENLMEVICEQIQTGVSRVCKALSAGSAGQSGTVVISPIDRSPQMVEKALDEINEISQENSGASFEIENTNDSFYNALLQFIMSRHENTSVDDPLRRVREDLRRGPEELRLAELKRMIAFNIEDDDFATKMEEIRKTRADGEPVGNHQFEAAQKLLQTPLAIFVNQAKTQEDKLQYTFVEPRNETASEAAAAAAATATEAAAPAAAAVIEMDSDDKITEFTDNSAVITREEARQATHIYLTESHWVTQIDDGKGGKQSVPIEAFKIRCKYNSEEDEVEISYASKPAKARESEPFTTYNMGIPRRDLKRKGDQYHYNAG